MLDKGMAQLVELIATQKLVIYLFALIKFIDILHV